MRNLYYWGVIAILVAILVIGVVFISPKSEERITATRIIDGDTIELSTGEIVRYVGVDTPEVSECYYEEAKEKNSEMVLNKEVVLRKEVSETDKYGRLLRDVEVDGTNVGIQLVRFGYATAFMVYPDNKNEWAINRSQDLAQQELLGLWSECNIK